MTKITVTKSIYELCI